MTRDVKPDWRIIKVDWTKYLDAEYREKRGIESVGVFYLADANLHVHICSFQPNVEAWPMCAYATFTSEEASERDEGNTELEMLNSEEACSYFGTEVLSHPWQPATRYFDVPEREEDESEEDWRMRVAEEAREVFAGNPCWF